MKTISFSKIHQNWYTGWRRVLVHVLFWLIILFYELFQTSIPIKSRDLVYYGYASKEIVTVVLLHYFLVYYAVPKYLLKKRWFYFTICILLAYTVMTATLYYTFYLLKSKNLVPEQYTMFTNFILQKDFFSTLIDPLRTYNVILQHSTLFFTLLVKITKDFFTSNIQNERLEKEKIKLEKENLKLELNFLKSQINPHFFFNTLNNIYSLIVDKDEVAADIIVKLSDLMRYSLYESGQSKISLNQELQFIRDYVDLEKIRHKDHVNINLNIQNKSGSLEVPPLILITFIENAFKHGVNNNIGASWVDINVCVENNELTFAVQNSKPQKLQEEKTLGGIGIMNVRRRLDLLYPNRYQLIIENEPAQYLVALKIQLDEKATHLHNRRRRAPGSEPSGEIHPKSTVPDPSGQV